MAPETAIKVLAPGEDFFYATGRVSGATSEWCMRFMCRSARLTVNRCRAIIRGDSGRCGTMSAVFMSDPLRVGEAVPKGGNPVILGGRNAVLRRQRRSVTPAG